MCVWGPAAGVDPTNEVPIWLGLVGLVVWLVGWLFGWCCWVYFFHMIDFFLIGLGVTENLNRKRVWMGEINKAGRSCSESDR